MSPPNVLLVCMDQWRDDALGREGHPVVMTPHLDQLAAESVRFARAYAATPGSPALGTRGGTTMSEPPKLKLVTRGRYAMLLGRWMIRFELALLCSILGVGLVLLELYDVALDIAVSLHAPIQVETPLEKHWQVLIFLVGFALALTGRKLFQGMRFEIPFTPITRENTHLLPPDESLVRASMPGPQNQQAALLRASQSGQEISPPEQLLRASPSSPESDTS